MKFNLYRIKRAWRYDSPDYRYVVAADHPAETYERHYCETAQCLGEIDLSEVVTAVAAKIKESEAS